MAEGSREAIRADDQVVSVAEVRELQKKVREMQRVLDKKTMENEILRDALQIAHEKKTYFAIAVLVTGRYGVKAVAGSLGVARSNLIKRLSTDQRKRESYVKADDADLLPLIRELDSRPMYGYRRITALLNRRFSAAGAPQVNHKRIFRIMKLHGPLLQCYTGQRIERAHDGAVRTLRSNMRWCSDRFEVSCCNGEIVCVAFTLDTCDREAITCTASTAGVTGEMIRDMMLVAVERRFGDYQAPHRVEYLAANGGCCTASGTIDFALAIGLMPRFTPICSPESNGMAESFVKTFKRD